MAVIKRIHPMIGALLILCSCATADAESSRLLKQKSFGEERVVGEYLIKITPGTNVKEIEKLFTPYKVEKIDLVGDRLYKIKLRNDPGVEIIKELAKKSAGIEYAEPNLIYKINTPSMKGKQHLK